MAIPETSRELLLKTLGQGNESQTQRSAFDQSGRAASGSTGTSFSDSLDGAVEQLKRAAGEVSSQKQKLLTEKTKLELRKEILSNSSIQNLLKQQGDLQRQIQKAPTKIEGKANVNPLVQGALQGGDISTLVGALSDVSGDIYTRGTGVQNVINAISKQREQDLTSAQADLQAQQGLVSSLLGVSAENRQQALLPGQLQGQSLQNTKLQQQVTGTEPLTAEQILSVGKDFANPQAVLDFLQNRQQQGTINRPQRDLNPLNLKVSPFTQKYIDQGLATIDPVPATDGGNFLKFNDLGAALTVSKDLLFNGANYRNLPLDAALRRWSGSGYGAEITGVSGNKKMKDLSAVERNKVIQAMMKREGFTAGASKQQLNNIFAPRGQGEAITPEQSANYGLPVGTPYSSLLGQTLNKVTPQKQPDVKQKAIAETGTNSAKAISQSLFGKSANSDNPQFKKGTLSLLTRAQTLVKSGGTGSFLPLGSDAQKTAADMRSLLFNYIYTLSGAQYSDKQLAAFANLLPGPADTADSAKHKIDVLLAPLQAQGGETQSPNQGVTSSGLKYTVTP